MAFAVTAQLLTGCGSSDVTQTDAAQTSPAAPTTAPASPSPTPTPTPTEISRDAAGAQYLTLVEPANAACATFSDAVGSDAIRAAAQACADALRTFADGLVAAQWPADTQSTVNDLVAAVSSEIAGLVRVAGSQSDDDLTGALATLVSDNSSAQHLRILLGLDNVSS